MTAEIVQFPKKDGNGAREAVMGVMRDPHMRWPLGEWDVPAVTEYFLISLWSAGFKIVPLDGTED